MPAPTISALTPAPNRLDPSFATVADAFLNGFPTLRAEINAFANYLNTTALVSYAFSDGTAAQPSMRFASDSNTGIFRASSDALGFATGGTESVRVTSAGKVGIGTTNPVSTVEINDRNSADTSLRIGNSLGLDLVLAGGTSGMSVGTPNVASLRFQTQSQDRMILSPYGNVGIGTNSPNSSLHIDTAGDSSLKVQSAGATYFGVETDGVNGIGLIKVSNDDTAGHLDIRTGPATSVAMRIDRYGKVGIGTTDPQSKFDVAGDVTVGRGTSPGEKSALFLYSNGTTARAASIKKLYDSPYDLTFTAAETTATEVATVFKGNQTNERMRIASNGRVGIGTSAPDNSLTVQGSQANIAIVNSIPGSSGSPSYMGLKFYGFAENASGHIASIEGVSSQSSNTAGRLRFLTKTSGASEPVERMLIDHNGNMGIGTSAPDKQLEVRKSAETSIRIRADGAGARTVDMTQKLDGDFNIAAQNGQDIYLSTGGSERVRVNSTGHLLIGTSSVEGAGGTTVHPVGYIATNRGTTSAANHLIFMNPNGAVGSVVTNGSTTSFNTSSDHRLKEDLQDILTPAERLMLLNPVNVSWKSDGTRSDTFIAHELAEVLPYAVTGEKDAADPDGNPEFQSVDYSKVVPLLTAALQEALTKIENLETRINVMEC